MNLVSTDISNLTRSVLVTLITLFAGCSRPDGAHTDGHGHDSAEQQDAKRGPHGGRLLNDGGFAVEVTIFEAGVPPEFRVFPFANGKPVAASDVNLSIELARFGGRVDRIGFVPKGDYLLGNSKVEEPHSFDVKVRSEYAGRSHEWTYESYEGRTRIDADKAREAGVTIGTAGPGKLSEQLTLHGTITTDPARQRKITARFPGVIQSVSRQVGDTVRAGETLAVVESNESLQRYSVSSPIGGTITDRHANVGENAGIEPLFEVADFASVRAELGVFPGDFAKLKKGQPVAVRSADGRITGQGTIAYLAAGGHARNQSLVAQVLLDNTKREWTPGLFISAEVVVGETSVAIAVPVTALQKFRDWDVVFRNEGVNYQAQPLQLGRSDGETAEVVAGLTSGDRYVATNSYLIKADIEKSGASHDH
jgi:membrane fusion protein, heavy metal efflux system